MKNEHLKYGESRLNKKLKNVLNEILPSKMIPNDEKKSNIILIHKKGDRHDIRNYPRYLNCFQN